MAMDKGQVEASNTGTGSYFSRMLSRIGGVFLAPDVTFKQIIMEKIGFWEPLILVLLLVGIQTAVMAPFVYVGSIMGGASLGFVGVAIVSVFLAAILSTLIVWVVVSGITHVVARYIFGGQGSFVQLMKLYAYSIVPLSLTILGAVLVGVSWTLWPLLLFFYIVAIFWIVLLMSVAVKHNYSIDIGKAFISSFIGPMVVWLVIVGISWAWIWLVINSFAGGFV